MNKRNYQKELDALIERNTREGIRPRLLLHVCCAVCASYVLEYLAPHFDITIAYYNPNITEESEYRYRYSELKRYVAEAGLSGSVHFTEVDYDPEAFLTLTEGREEEREGGARCALCFRQRLEYTARLCRDGGYDCFATTLTISPLKNAVTLNTIGEQLAEEYGVPYINYNETFYNIGLDYSVDFADWEHLNVRGSIKMSFRLGDDLRKYYQMPDHRGDPAYASYDACAEQWLAKLYKFLTAPEQGIYNL